MTDCRRCFGERWVCEEHPDVPQGHGTCTGAGMPCPDCNREDPPAMPPGWRSLIKPLKPER